MTSKVATATFRPRPDGPVLTWLEQDNWTDPRGPLGIDRPSPKLAELTPESPQWLHDLHRNGVSVLFNLEEHSGLLINWFVSGL